MRISKYKRKPLFLVVCAFGILLLAGCNEVSGNDRTTPMPTSSLTKIPTQAPDTIPSSTPEVTPDPTSTPAPTGTPTPFPKPTGTTGEVRFSESDYFFSEDIVVELSISSKKKDGYITYTLDGTEPTETNKLYDEPIVLTANDGDFPNAYSIRAKAWYDDGTVSDTYVHTYFLNKNIDTRYSTLVFSINGDPATLTDGPDGIFYGDNALKRGPGTERPIHVEALTSDGTLLFEQHAGVRVVGGTSRKHAIKSLKLYARKDYQKDKGTFALSVFGSTMLDSDEPIVKYDKMVLRNGGDDFQSGFLRDELMQRLAMNAGFDTYEAVIPAIAYVNGSYYGFYWLHETYCDKYFQYRNGKSNGEYVVLEGTDTHKAAGNEEIENNAAKEYNAMYNKYAYADLTNDTTFEELCTYIDVANYLDYMSFNIYGSNSDWPKGNYRCFRYYAEDGVSYGDGEMDGRWRYLLHDTDVCFGTYRTDPKAGADRNDLEITIGSENYECRAPLLAALLKREDCRDYFINCMISYMNDTMSYDTVCTILDGMLAERDTELAYYFDYLNTLKGKEDYSIYSSPSRTETHINKIRIFAEHRPAEMIQMLEDYFNVDLSQYTE